MIGNFSHKGLKAFYENSSVKGVAPEHVGRIDRILSILDSATSLHDIQSFQSLGCHRLQKGELRGFYAVKVTGSWRIVFRFEHGKAIDVGYVQYH